MAWLYIMITECSRSIVYVRIRESMVHVVWDHVFTTRSRENMTHKTYTMDSYSHPLFYIIMNLQRHLSCNKCENNEQLNSDLLCLQNVIVILYIIGIYY